MTYLLFRIFYLCKFAIFVKFVLLEIKGLF